jgi:hypothetical protein
MISDNGTGRKMSKDNRVMPPEVNQMIIKKLRSYPDSVSELAIKAIQLSENLPEATVFEALQGMVRDLARKMEVKS